MNKGDILAVMRERLGISPKQIVVAGDGAKEVFACDLLPGEPIREIDVDIKGAKTLILSALSSLCRDQETGVMRYDSIPHVAVCEPCLIRTA